MYLHYCIEAAGKINNSINNSIAEPQNSSILLVHKSEVSWLVGWLVGGWVDRWKGGWMGR